MDNTKSDDVNGQDRRKRGGRSVRGQDSKAPGHGVDHGIRERAIEILRRQIPKEQPTPPEPSRPAALEPLCPAKTPPPSVSPAVVTEPMPARMLNEFVYCPRLFYYEFVEGVFVENADTIRGSAIHKRVDSGKGALPAARTSRRRQSNGEKHTSSGTDAGSNAADGAVQNRSEPEEQIQDEVIHSRSVQMGSERLGVIAKMDLVEARVVEPDAPGKDPDLFAALEVCPVDYKAGAPKEGADANELWDTDKIQLGLQALILRENGYICREGLIYYRATRQRVRLAITQELEDWILGQIADARRAASGPMPPPLVDSPKCVRCSLAPVCLPDETRALTQAVEPSEAAPASPSALVPESRTSGTAPSTSAPRRLIAARDDKRPLYLNSQGLRVGCKDEVLQVKDKDKLVEEIRMRDVSHVALFGNIQISTQAVQALCMTEIPVTYFSMGGYFYGITRGHGLKNVFTRLEQFRLAGDPIASLALSRQFVHGKIRNHRTMLMRNHSEPPAAAVLRLKRAAEDALNASSIDELLGIEGAAAGLYFQNFTGMIKVDDAAGPLPEAELVENTAVAAAPPRPLTFDFTGRNRRPPTDPVNAMLSLAYSLLSKDCTIAAMAVGFDPYVGFFHQPRFGRPALALDLMEEFRPLIAESTVLNCINNRVITEKDFVRAGDAVNLSAPGRKRFFQTYEQRMSALITHPMFEYKVSYRRALELQARLLAKTLTGDIPEYSPFLTR